MTVTHTIGTGLGRDFASLEAWEQATDIQITQIYEGIVYHDDTAGLPTFTYSNAMDRLLIQGATNSAWNKYRRLAVAVGHKYDPVTQTGVWIKRQTNSVSSVKRDFIHIQENHFRLEDFAVIDDLTNPSTAGHTTFVKVIASVHYVRVMRLFVRGEAGLTNGVDGTSSSYGIEVGINCIDCTISNCIVEGGEFRGNRGLTTGIHWQTGSSGVTIGCTVKGVVGFNTGTPGACRGISSNSLAPIYNSIAVRDLSITALNALAADFWNLTSQSQGLVSSDTSATYAFGDVHNNISNVTAGELFYSPINSDFRLFSTAPAQNWPGQQYLYDQYDLYDFFGTLRSNSYADLGASGQTPLFGAEGPPTVVVSTIGTGGTYTTLAAWELATRVNLIETNEVHIAEVTADLSSATTLMVAQGAITDSHRYRMIRPAEGNEYAISADAGCTLSTTGSASSAHPCLEINERFFRVEGPMKVTMTGVSTNGSDGVGAVVMVKANSRATLLDSLWITIDTTSSAASFFTGVVFEDASRQCVIKNCVVWGHGGVDNKSVQAGIRVRGLSAEVFVFNCTVHDAKLLSTAGTQEGIKIDSSVECWVQNCIVTSSRTDFGTMPAGTVFTNCISSDATATGADSFASQSPANIFVDSVARNFYLRAGISRARESGQDRTAVVSFGLHTSKVLNDAHGFGRYTPFDIGGVEGAKPYPQGPPAKSRTRVCRCYEIIRADSVRFLLTDNSTPISFRGSTWSPMSFDSSATRRELGMKASSRELSGFISSDKITVEDLRAGRYQHATITEYIIDWRYPHLRPLLETRHTIQQTTYSGEHWEADVQGLPYQLKSKVGEVYGRTCKRTLGDEYCRATFVTQINKTVLDAVTPRRTVYLLNTELSVVTDDYFAMGKLTWLTGNNAQMTHELLSSAVVTANHVGDPNVLIGTSSYWTQSVTVAISAVPNGFASGVPSYLFARTANVTDGGLESTGLALLWKVLFPKGTKATFSVYVKRPSTTPASYCSIGFTETTPTKVEHRAAFQWLSNAWVSIPDTEDIGVVGTATEITTDWWRLSCSLTSDGSEQTGVGCVMRVGTDKQGEANKDLEFARAQLEPETLTPTTWTQDTKYKLVLAIPTPLEMQAGDTFNLEPGCNKLRATCRDKFDNIVNFGGWPFIPGGSKMFDTPTQ
tara:strand:+ start:2894 stop:6394 length:3501 start_codon:yes stop_codon:yes gene_type:complete